MKRLPSGSLPQRHRISSLIGIVVAMSMSISACAAIASTPTAIPTISLDDNSSSSATQPNAGNLIAASAVVVPVKDAQLSFSAAGRVTEVNVEVGDRVTAGQTLVRLDTSIQEAQIREAEANLLAAQIDLNYKIRLGLDKVHRETAEAEVARRQALLDSANAVLAAQSALTAPFAGTIVSVEIAPAETVVPGQPVIVLGDLSRYQIETTDLSERDVPHVRIGQPARVFIEALEEEIPGKVVDVDRISSTLGGDVVFTVTIELFHQPEELRWGMSADVQFEPAD